MLTLLFLACATGGDSSEKADSGAADTTDSAVSPQRIPRVRRAPRRRMTDNSAPTSKSRDATVSRAPSATFAS